MQNELDVEPFVMVSYSFSNSLKYTRLVFDASKSMEAAHKESLEPRLEARIDLTDFKVAPP